MPSANIRRSYRKTRSLRVIAGLAVAAAPAGHLGKDRLRSQRPDPRGSGKQLADHADHALPDGRVWSAPDRLAEPQGRGRVGGQADDRMGLHERPSRAMGFRQRRRHAASGLAERAVLRLIVSPVKDSLVGEVLAWTPSTKGTVTADAVHVVPPTRPTQAELDAWIEEMTPKVKGKIVLVGPQPTVVRSTSIRRRCVAMTRSCGSSWIRMPRPATAAAGEGAARRTRCRRGRGKPSHRIRPG